MSEVPTVQQSGGPVAGVALPGEVQPAADAPVAERRLPAAPPTPARSHPFADRVERVRELMARRASIHGSRRA